MMWLYGGVASGQGHARCENTPKTTHTVWQRSQKKKRHTTIYYIQNGGVGLVEELVEGTRYYWTRVRLQPPNRAFCRGG